MAYYRFRFLEDGKPVSQVDHDHADDLDALAKAEILSVDSEVEVWDGDRFVARVKKGNPALNEEDRTSN
jgi:hypothetical protein